MTNERVFLFNQFYFEYCHKKAESRMSHHEASGYGKHY